MRRRSRRTALAALTLGAIATIAAADTPVYPSAEAVRPLEPGTPIPDVTLTTVKGRPFALARELRNQAAMLVFYRGGW
jgi:hypothetical protein